MWSGALVGCGKFPQKVRAPVFVESKLPGGRAASQLLGGHELIGIRASSLVMEKQ
jgi:hypothetical protein